MNRPHRNSFMGIARMSHGWFFWPVARPYALWVQLALRHTSDRRRFPFSDRNTLSCTPRRSALSHGPICSYLRAPQLTYTDPALAAEIQENGFVFCTRESRREWRLGDTPRHPLRVPAIMRRSVGCLRHTRFRHAEMRTIPVERAALFRWSAVRCTAPVGSPRPIEIGIRSGSLTSIAGFIGFERYTASPCNRALTA